MNADDADPSEIAELMKDFFLRQIASARLGLPYRQESSYRIDLGLSEQLLDDAFQLLFSIRETIPRTVKIHTKTGFMTMDLSTKISIDTVWPVWLMVKERLRAMPEHAPLLLLLDPDQRSGLFEMMRTRITYQHGTDEGYLRLFVTLAIDDVECAIDISDVLWRTICGLQPPKNQYTLELIRGAANPKERRLRPIEYPLPEQTLINGEAMYVVLRTLRDLEHFWQTHRAEFPFAAKGARCGPYQIYLDDYQWVFAKSKIALIKTVTRWDQTGITCYWYDWAKEAPSEWAHFFVERDRNRAQKMALGTWRDKDEADYLADCERRTSENYRGWWALSNLPDDCPFSDWMFIKDKKIIDSALSIDAATALLQELTFDDWANYDEGGICIYDVDWVDGEIAFWHEEKANGEEYYGMENERNLH